MKKLLLFLLVVLFLGPSLSQTTRVTTQSGFWSNPSTWDTGVPQSGDNIVVNHTLEVDVKDTVTNILINDVTTLYDTLFIKGILNVEANLTNGVVYFINNCLPAILSYIFR
jgi:hypothetical protein